MLFLSSQFSSAQVRGVTDTEIIIGQWGPQTGPASISGAVARGTDLLVKLINEEGGINGRKFKYYIRDDSYQPDKTKAVTKELVEEVRVFAIIGGCGIANGMVVRDYLMENKVPWFGPVSGAYEWTHPAQKYLFSIYPLYEDDAYHLTKYLYEKLNYKKIGVIYQNDSFGERGLKGVERCLSPIAKVSVEVTDGDLSTHALKLKMSGAQAVILWVLPKHAALLLGESAKIGFKPQWAATNVIQDPSVMMKLTKGLWVGTIYSFLSDFPESNSPLMIKYREAQERLAPKENWNAFYIGGIVFSEAFFEGIRRAGRNLTTETWIKAMETLKDWRGIGIPITFTPTERQGGKHVYYVKVKPDGSLEKLTEWEKITK